MKKTLLCISIATLLSACGGGSSSDDGGDPVTNITPTQINGEATSITDTNITVAGYSLDAQNADITYDDQPISLQDIQQNMRVEVETNGQGQATEIELDANLVGQVTNTTTDSITVNGTMLSTTNASSFSIDDWVFVNGYPDASGEWYVENVFKIDRVIDAEIEGIATKVTASSFYIGSTQVDYSIAQLDDGTPNNGDWVEVDGNFVSGIFQASEVDIENDDRYDGNGDVELEGTISWVNSEQSLFELNGRTQISTTSTTRYEDGSQADLTEGKQVDVELSNTDNRLIALKVEFENASTSTPTNNTNFTLAGTATYISASEFSINGFTFMVDNRTKFAGNLTINNIANTQIEIEGVETTSGDYLVYEVEAMDLTENEIDLEGDVTNGQIWGYSATDNSISNHNGNRVELECNLININTDVSNCRIDD